MTSDLMTTVTTAPDIERDARETRFDDREWIAAEFAAIMTASGFGDRVMAALDSGPPRSADDGADRIGPQRRRADRAHMSCALIRVRSPPRVDRA